MHSLFSNRAFGFVPMVGVLWMTAAIAPFAVAATGAAKSDSPVTQPSSDEPSTTRPTTLPAGVTVETIVFFRHGEKPATGLGQITPQGFNRALALSTLLPSKFGKPDYLFAPDPKEQTTDHGRQFCYVRPLATIEPLAIRLEMPVQTSFGYREIAELNHEIASDHYAGAVLFIAWEHVYEQKAVVELIDMFNGDSSKIPPWAGSDYDSLYIVKITRRPDGPATAAFTLDHEELNGQSKMMPTPAAK